MTDLPEAPHISVTSTEILTLELSDDQIAQIVLEWAKSRGFSHRAKIEFEARYDMFDGCTITETRTKSSE